MKNQQYMKVNASRSEWMKSSIFIWWLGKETFHLLKFVWARANILLDRYPIGGHQCFLLMKFPILWAPIQRS